MQDCISCLIFKIQDDRLKIGASMTFFTKWEQSVLSPMLIVDKGVYNVGMIVFLEFVWGLIVIQDEE